MSMPALLQGVLARLQAAGVLTTGGDASGTFTGIQTDGQPPANAGQWYYAIHAAGGRNADDNPLSDDRMYDVTVTITRRMAEVPDDRRGSRTLLDSELFAQAEKVALAVHGNYAVLATANGLISGFGVTTNGFIEPLKYATGAEGPIQEKGAEWVHSKPTGREPTIYVLAVQFKSARRVRVLG